jgi:hypothetical protein
MAGRTDGGAPVTVLEHLLRQRDQTYEEIVAEFHSVAEGMDERATMSPRHLRRLAKGQAGNATPVTRRVLQAMFGRPASELLSTWQQETRVPGTAVAPLGRSTGDTGPDPSRVAEAAQQSLEFAAWADQSPVSVMEDVSYELGRIASCYVHRPAGPLFDDLLRLRDITFGMLRRGIPPRQARDMCVLVGTTCVLLAHATENLGDPVSAMAQARAAWACADQADHDGLRGWVRGTAALIAEWTGRPAYAAQLARDGQEYAQPAESMVRLAAIEARAQARAGNMPGAMEALDRARRARGTEAGSRDGLLEYGGLLAFPPVKQQYYEGSTLILAGQHAAGETATLEAIGLYESGPPQERSYGDEAIARVDVITARVVQRDLDGACAAARPVLALPPEQRIEQLADTLSQVTRKLALPPFAASSIARDLAGEIREFTASSSRPALGR